MQGASGACPRRIQALECVRSTRKARSRRNWRKPAASAARLQAVFFMRNSCNGSPACQTARQRPFQAPFCLPLQGWIRPKTSFFRSRFDSNQTRKTVRQGRFRGLGFALKKGVMRAACGTHPGHAQGAFSAQPAQASRQRRPAQALPDWRLHPSRTGLEQVLKAGRHPPGKPAFASASAAKPVFSLPL